MERIKSLPKRDPALFILDSSLNTKYEQIIKQPEIIKLQDELRAFVKKMNEKKASE